MLPLRKIALFLLTGFVFAGKGISSFDSVKRNPGHGLILDGKPAKQAIPAKVMDVELTQDEIPGSGLRIRSDDIVQSSHSHKVEPTTTMEGRGKRYAAAVPISKGDEILSIPMDKILSVETATTGRIHTLVKANPHLPSAVVLALHLLEEKFKGTSSKWHSFIASLPRSYHGTLFLSDDEAELMQGSHLARLTDTRRQAIEEFFEALESPLTSPDVMDPPFFTPTQFTLKNFQLAMAAVWTHTILLPKSIPDDATADDASPSDPFEAVLVPIVSTLAPCDDCVNDIRVEDGFFVMRATHSYAAGDEVQLHFGDNSMALYMLNHGITPAAPSTLDVVPLGLHVEASDPLLMFKTHILTLMNTTMETTYALAYGVDPLTSSSNFLPSLRAKVLVSAELEHVQRILDGGIVSLRNEHAVCRALLQTVLAMLAQYATNARDVESALKDPTLPASTRHLMRALHVEQAVLSALHAAVTSHWATLLADDSLLHPTSSTQMSMADDDDDAA
ncbi:Aste57867_18120 [Aphanomyces stellatus]|uniref:Aste57867_18120 protein n=1 Tax=Aphanomyces stellatus TaxID=120398 RepID=A0A485LA49_9STRA|nr:hypothetical protein As57867_018058 [Aphanomyces stellatus]VFT94858.1 Aste57867_18120 [Aphanomyces stellatus]